MGCRHPQAPCHPALRASRIPNATNTFHLPTHTTRILHSHSSYRTTPPSTHLLLHCSPPACHSLPCHQRADKRDTQIRAERKNREFSATTAIGSICYIVKTYRASLSIEWYTGFQVGRWMTLF